MKKISDDIVRWGILGAGDVCEVKSAPAMNLIHNSRLVAVMRRNADKARDYAERHGVPSWYDDAGKLVHDPEVNAIYIATPPDAHSELTRLAAEAGKPVYVEKPMARTHKECLEMIEVCKKAKVPLYTAYYRRMLPNFLKVKELVDADVAGEIRMVEIRMRKPVEPPNVSIGENNWRVDPDIAGGGYFYDLASHQLDFLDYLFGPVTEACGISANQAGLYDAEDIVTGSFRFENGVMGCGSWCFTTGPSLETDLTVVTGSKGEISYPSFGESWVELKTGNADPERFHFSLPTHIQQPLIETIVQDLLGKGSCPSTGITGARTNLVLEKLAHDSGKSDLRTLT
jgi:predicted dehydrogenase